MLAVGRWYSFHQTEDPTYSYVIIYPGNGKGGDYLPQLMQVNNRIDDIHFTDVNEDKKPDIIMAHSMDVWVPGNYYTAGLSTHLNQTIPR